MWQWAFRNNEVRSSRTKSACELPTALEYYLGRAFELIEFTRSRGIWCDGVLELSIARINRLGFLLSGVAYPIDVLPGWLRVGSAMLPHTYALEGLRLALLQGHSVSQLLPEITALALFAVVIVPVSLLTFNHAVHRVRVEGSFAQF